MTGCDEREATLTGLLDGELDAANTAAAEAHLASCRDCREAYARLQALRRAIVHSDARSAAPDSLRRRVELEVGQSAVAGRAARVPAWLAPAVGGALAASLALLAVTPSLTRPSLDDELIAGHIRSLQAAHLTDVRTSNEHVVRPWFNGKIDFAPPVPELSPQGFPLVGGRLDYVEGRTVAALVYGRRLHTINLFVWPARDTAAQQRQRAGYAVSEWSEAGLRYAAVSDIAPADLEQFRQAFVAAAAR